MHQFNHAVVATLDGFCYDGACRSWSQVDWDPGSTSCRPPQYNDSNFAGEPWKLDLGNREPKQSGNIQRRVDVRGGLRDFGDGGFNALAYTARQYKQLEDSGWPQTPNALRLLAAFRHGKSFYFLFPWASGGSLRSFWRAHPQPVARSEIATWVAEQSLGIATALHEIHCEDGSDLTLGHDFGQRCATSKVRGYHGDIKAENILLFEGDRYGDHHIWKIGDFGVSKRFLVAPRGGDVPIGFTPTYQSPEHHTEGRNYEDITSVSNAGSSPPYGDDSLSQFQSYLQNRLHDPHRTQQNTSTIQACIDLVQGFRETRGGPSLPVSETPSLVFDSSTFSTMSYEYQPSASTTLSTTGDYSFKTSYELGDADTFNGLDHLDEAFETRFDKVFGIVMPEASSKPLSTPKQFQQREGLG
ncbi:hypothetical protein GQX73_g8627 [Xylaria multiplex]|uniref:Protein kinase domain-containing protein n=1 Tax=Xylaria multiplex TaxID=323545 RepID=A0A7C8MPT3_9PEZI|nr:hypothetical protein GQX73_g8627 [Xylaria multiplex]